MKESKRKVYFFRYPKPELLLKFGYNKIDTLEQIEQLRNMILVIDEPQLYFGIYDKKSNDIIAKLCSMSRQFNITLIIASSDTRVFTRHNESYFDLWLVKDLDYDMVKNGSKIRNIVRKNVLFDPSGFRLNNNEFLSECRILSEFNGKHKFGLPRGWNEDISTPYK